jgi:fructose-1,6-bisphosphatase I
MVADIHRNMIKGGIFIYPTTSSAPNGKLRLVYECNPMAFIIEQAGGRATDGLNRILEKDVHSLHQRSAIFIGSENMVNKAEYLMSKNIKSNSGNQLNDLLYKTGVIGGVD